MLHKLSIRKSPRAQRACAGCNRPATCGAAALPSHVRPLFATTAGTCDGFFYSCVRRTSCNREVLRRTLQVTAAYCMRILSMDRTGQAAGYADFSVNMRYLCIFLYKVIRDQRSSSAALLLFHFVRVRAVMSCWRSSQSGAAALFSRFRNCSGKSAKRSSPWENGRKWIQPDFSAPGCFPAIRMP